MSESRNFQADLYSDIHRLYKQGFARSVEPRRTPALAELAAALSPGAESHNDAVENVLHRALPFVARNLLDAFDVSETAIIKGLTELFGMTDDSGLRRGARQEKAGKALGKGGKNGLRRAEHKKTFVIQLIVRKTTAQLVVMGNAVGFLYSGRFLVAQKPDAAGSRAALERLLDTAPNNPVRLSV